MIIWRMLKNDKDGKGKMRLHFEISGDIMFTTFLDAMG